MHVDTDLSAYLDEELAPAERARVESHLDACARCRARLGELRATAALIAALPSARPGRSLVPRVSERYNWLRPLRSLSTFATGAFLFAFVLTAVGRSGSGLGGGGTAMPFGAAPAAPAATAAAAPQRATIGTPQAIPAAGAPGEVARARTPSPAPFAFQTTPQAGQRADAASPAAPPRADALGSPPADTHLREPRREPPPFTDPLMWLGFAVIAAVIAIGAHWRLRST
jgi:anti-sigma factor RsiW